MKGRTDSTTNHTVLIGVLLFVVDAAGRVAVLYPRTPPGILPAETVRGAGALPARPPFFWVWSGAASMEKMRTMRTVGAAPLHRGRADVEGKLRQPFNRGLRYGPSSPASRAAELTM
jgi:hypothetical protein